MANFLDGGPALDAVDTPLRPAGADTVTGSPESDATQVRLLALIAAARHHGVELDRDELRVPPGEQPSPATLVEWLRSAGLWARAVRLNWRSLMKVETSSPVVLLLSDGSAGLMVQSDVSRNVVWLKDPVASGDAMPVAIDELRLSQVWGGEVILLRALRAGSEEEAPFNIAWLARLVMLERKTLRDVFLASLVLSVLTILPPLIVMTVVDKVVTHEAYAT
jgi:ATP-binding cassette subfamily B protein